MTYLLLPGRHHLLTVFQLQYLTMVTSGDVATLNDVDIGYCTGSLIQQLAQDNRLRESDFYGVEVARRLYQECLHRKEQGAFANDNWQSEMHETFCFWSFAEWRAAVEAAGFVVHPASHAYTNPWIVENRYRGKVGLFLWSGGSREPLAFPVTNMVLVAAKR